MTFYITTPIYYVNAKPHLGHAYTTLVNDTLNRYHRLAGEETYFLTGTDEHGDKIVQAAAKAGQSPSEYVDRISAMFQAAWPKLNIEHNDFIRTTEERHKKVVWMFLERVHSQGDIYFSGYGGHYCFGCERFYTEKEMVNGKCPDHQTELKFISEDNYFFRMSNYQDWLIDHIKKNPDFIRPERYRNEVLGFLRDPLDDLCISRPKTRLTWGIDLPFDDRFVTYVWFDALINYISALGWPDGEKYQRYWPVVQHTIAKDILKPHAIFWPTMLQSAGLPIYQHLNVHGYWQMGQAKMGKSIGNVVDALTLSEVYGTDAFRYFLMRDMVFGLDSEFVEDALVNRFNADLANDLGNLWQRTLTMLAKFCGGLTPGRQMALNDENIWSRHLAEKFIAEYRNHFENLAIHRALTLTWELITSLNRFIDSEAPWALAKNPEQADHLSGVFYRLINGLALIGAMIWPVMPRTGEDIWRRLGLDPRRITLDLEQIVAEIPRGRKVSPGAPLFPRVEFGGTQAKTKAEAIQEKDPVPPKKAKADIPPAESVSFEEFKRLDLRVAVIKGAEAIPKSDRLLKFTVQIGEEERIIVAGIAKYFPPEELIGQRVIVVANLAPAKLMGIPSQGMILAASNEGALTLLTTLAPIPSGAKVS